MLPVLSAPPWPPVLTELVDGCPPEPLVSEVLEHPASIAAKLPMIPTIASNRVENTRFFTWTGNQEPRLRASSFATAIRTRNRSWVGVQWVRRAGWAWHRRR